MKLKSTAINYSRSRARLRKRCDRLKNLFFGPINQITNNYKLINNL